MSNLVMWGLVTAFFMPLVISVVQQPTWPSWLRVVVTGVVSVVGGLGTAYFNGDFNAGDVVGSVLIVLVASITFYKNFWKPVGVAPAIENKTSKTPPPVEAVHPDGAPRSGAGNIQNPLTGTDETGRASAGYVLACCVGAALLIVVFFAWAWPALSGGR